MKSNPKKSKKNARYLNSLYTNRMSIVKQALDSKNKGDFINALRYYNKYLGLLAEIKNTELIDLHPQYFDKKRDLPELLLISHIYWEQVKILDRTESHYAEFKNALNKFLLFTFGLDYQVVNAEMLRKFLRRGQMVHRADFQEAYKKIYTSSKKCFIATFCFGDEHLVTNLLRLFKNQLAQWHWGCNLIAIYYRYSEPLTVYADHHPLIALLLRLSLRPLLLICAILLFPFYAFADIKPLSNSNKR